MRLAVSLVIFAGIIAWQLPAFAIEQYLQWDNDVADSFSHEADRAYITYFETPEDWTSSLCSAVKFYGRRYGDVSGIYGTVVVYAPPEDMSTIYEAPEEERLQVLARKQFELTNIPADGGWLEVSVDPVKVDGEFAVVIYTYCTDDHGVELGLSAPTGHDSHSGDFYMTKVRVKEEDGMEEVQTTDHRIWRTDQREWMIRALISPTVAPPETVTPVELSGPNIAFHDDGTAEGYYTSQQYGPLVEFTAKPGNRVNRIYVMAYLEGDWFETDREASIYLMDDELRILQRKKLAYAKYATEPAWNYADFDDIPVTEQFYVLVEPVSRPAVKMFIGADTSGVNEGSLWGTAGTILAWDSEAPEESTNWMIRVRFQ
jgi:hypothetical protein